MGTHGTKSSSRRTMRMISGESRAVEVQRGSGRKRTSKNSYSSARSTLAIDAPVRERGQQHVRRDNDAQESGKNNLHLLLKMLAVVTLLAGATIAIVIPLNTMFSPFRSELASFDIYNKAGKPIGSIAGGDVWRGDTHYPGIQAYASQPFLCDQFGREVYNDSRYYAVDQDGVMQFQFTDGSYKYLRRVNLRVDLAMQTLTNFPEIKYGKYLINPLDNIAFSPTTWYGLIGSTPSLYSDNDGNHPYGVLMVDVDYGSRTPTAGYGYGDYPFNRGWVVKGVGITTSLENFKDMTGMMANLSSRYGNSEIKVIPRLDFKAIENFIKYDYYKIVNGQQFHVFTNTTQMAIIDASFVNGAPQVGRVANYAPPQDFTISIDPTNTGGTAGSGSAAGDAISERPGVTDVTLKASYTLTRTESEYMPSTIVPPRTLNKNFTTPVSVDINSFHILPKTAQVRFDQYIQPYTQVHWATYTGHACGYAHYYLNTVWEQSKLDQPSWTDKFPYRVSIENVYSINSIVFSLLILSDNNVEYIPTEGQPIKVTDLADYGINSVGVLNPNFDDASSVLVLSGFNASEWLNDMAWFIVLIVGSVIAVMVILLLLMRARNQKQSQGQRKSWFKWFS